MRFSPHRRGGDLIITALGRDAKNGSRSLRGPPVNGASGSQHAALPAQRPAARFLMGGWFYIDMEKRCFLSES